MFIETNIERYM